MVAIIAHDLNVCGRDLREYDSVTDLPSPLNQLKRYWGHFRRRDLNRGERLLRGSTEARKST